MKQPTRWRTRLTPSRGKRAKQILPRPGIRTRYLWQVLDFVIGAFIAAAFPSTEAEENLFGQASDELRLQAERVGVDAARTAVEGVAAAASEQGLSVDGLTKVGENLF